MNVNGLWATEFFSNNADAGAGVVVFLDGRVLGGDASYYYSGQYEIQGTALRAALEVTHFHGPMTSIFGPLSKLHLVIEGSISEQWIMGQGYDPSMPSRRIAVRLKRLQEL